MPKERNIKSLIANNYRSKRKIMYKNEDIRRLWAENEELRRKLLKYEQ